MSDPVDLRAGRGACVSNCAPSEACLYTDQNPNGGATSFDNVFDALVNIFQAVSLEGWSSQMHQLSVSVPGVAIAYYITLVVFGSFFVVNLYDTQPQLQPHQSHLRRSPHVCPPP